MCVVTVDKRQPCGFLTSKAWEVLQKSVRWEGNIDVFARNWNIFKIAAGMGAVRYCN